MLDTARFALENDDRKVDVEPQVLKLLQYLIENRDRVVSRTELLDKVFGRRIVTDNALTVRIRAARQAVGDTANAQSVIATIQGGGYRFVASVAGRYERVTFGGNNIFDARPGPAPSFQTCCGVPVHRPTTMDWQDSYYYVRGTLRWN